MNRTTDGRHHSPWFKRCLNGFFIGCVCVAVGTLAIMRQIGTSVEPTPPAPASQPDQPDAGHPCLRVRFRNPRAHQHDVKVHIDLGTAQQRTVVLSPTTTDHSINLPPGSHTVDVHPVTGHELLTFRVVAGDEHSLPLASPMPVLVPANEIVIDPPILLSQSTSGLGLPTMDRSEPAALRIVKEGERHFPCLVELYQQGQMRFNWPSRGTPGRKTIPPGSYEVRVRPERPHFPLPYRILLEGQGNSAASPRLADPRGIAVTVAEGQTLTVVVEEFIESYNQKAAMVNGVLVNLIFNRPYLHYDNGQDGPVFRPSAGESTPNTLVEYLELGDGMLDALGAFVADNVRSDAESPAPRWEHRRHHLTLLHTLDEAGGIPASWKQLTTNDLRRILTAAINRLFSEVLRRPYRTRDAMAIHTHLRRQEYQVMSLDERERYGSRIRGLHAVNGMAEPGAMEPLHYSKLDALNDFGSFYLKRWKRRSTSE